MQIANRDRLDAERNAILSAFDAAWMAARSKWDTRARRAVHCAQRLAQANTNHLIGSWGMAIDQSGRLAGRFIIRA